jgi:hypothetical protein
LSSDLRHRADAAHELRHEARNRVAHTELPQRVQAPEELGPRGQKELRDEERHDPVAISCPPERDVAREVFVGHGIDRHRVHARPIARQLHLERFFARPAPNDARELDGKDALDLWRVERLAAFGRHRDRRLGARGERCHGQEQREDERCARHGPRMARILAALGPFG